MRLLLLTTLACLLQGTPHPSAAQLTPEPSQPEPASQASPILVELFTSEGCSDCPPADLLLREINGTQTASRQPIFALSEHVTYWDRLDWKDSFSDDVFTERQNGYSGKFALDSVYTPQMVVNGRRQFVGNNPRALRDALRAEAPRPGVDLRILSLEPMVDGLSVHFAARHVPSSGVLDLMAAITDDQDETHVVRGENGGRTLTHVAVARSLSRIAELRGDTDRQIHIRWPSALKANPVAARHLLLFVQQQAFGPVVGVTSAAITPAATVARRP